MTALNNLLTSYRKASQTEREKGTYFEELICTYFRYEASYKDLYSDVWLYSDWAKEQGINQRDVGIDLVTGVFQDSCRLKLLNYAVFFLSLSVFLFSGFK